MEQLTLFDTPTQSKHDVIRYSLLFEFRENDTPVYQRSLIITTHPLDWHFKARLMETVQKEITLNEQFVMTHWNKREQFNYSDDLEDSGSILPWLNQKTLLTLFRIA